MRVKQYVAVEVYYGPDGTLKPCAVEWEDGRIFHIDAVSRPVRTYARCGSAGLRYLCRIGQTQTYLFYEDPAWFVEKKVSLDLK